MTARRMSDVLYNRNIGALLIAPLPSGRGHLRLDWEKFAAIALGYSLVWPTLHRAVNHQFRSTQLALRQLRKRGYRRPGLALPASYDQRTGNNFLGSFLVEQHRLGGTPLPIHLPDDKNWNFKGFRNWVDREKPDVIIRQHEEVLEWLRTMKMDVPREIGVIHLNCPKDDPSWAGIVQNAAAVGAAAVDHLVGMLHRNERGIPALPNYLLIEGTWRDGGTIRNKKSETSVDALK
jgi:hypothetical protein